MSYVLNRKAQIAQEQALIEGRPTLVLMAGLSGSGKSNLALAMGKRLGWPVLDKDSVKSPLLELGASEGLAGQASYVVLYELARDLIVGQRLSVILDTPAAYPRVIEAARDIVAARDARLRIILCKADTATRQDRLQTRSARPSQPHAIGPRAGDGRITYEHLPAATLIVNTARPIDAVVDEAVQYILTD
jgi:predicted kinase